MTKQQDTAKGNLIESLMAAVIEAEGRRQPEPLEEESEMEQARR